MTMRTTIIATGALLALAACGRGGDTTANTTTSTEANLSAPVAEASPAVSAAQAFANAAASDTFEIETSKLALANSTSKAVKSYADKMIAAHTASTAKLKTAAAPLTPDATLSATQQQSLDQLKTLTGKAFDTAYLAEQTAGHQQTLDTLKAYAAGGDAPELKAFASGLIPTVTAHLNMVKGMKA